MEEQKSKQPQTIDLRAIVKKLWANKRVFYKTLPATFVIACIYIMGLPRYYKTEARLAPEVESSGAGGALSSIASSFGFDIGDMQTTDAITPLLYPDLMDDNGFVASMFDFQVESLDGEIKTSYHDYMQKYQKVSVWSMPINWIKEFLKPASKGGDEGEFDPYRMSKNDHEVAEAIRGNIKLSVDKKNGVISISVEAQDPLICKTVADSLKNRLQLFITNYRTSKARNDYEYYKELTAKAKEEYEVARLLYSKSSDANMDAVMVSTRTKLEALENDAQIKLSTYTSMHTQMEAAKAKVQERTPAFTVIQGAAVPVKPAGPKRMIFVLAMTIVAFIATSIYLVRDELHLQF